jgi:hypothetical protein
VPAITALPAGPTSAISKAGMTSSPLPIERRGRQMRAPSRERSDPSSPTPAAGAATAAAAIASPLFTCGCLSRETSTAPHAAVSARNRMAIRPIHVGSRYATGDQIVGSSAPQKINDVPIGLSIQVREAPPCINQKFTINLRARLPSFKIKKVNAGRGDQSRDIPKNRKAITHFVRLALYGSALLFLTFPDF